MIGELELNVPSGQIAVAEKLGSAFSFARNDLYEHRGRVYFGEITHTSGVGLATFCPTEFDRALGTVLKTGMPIPERHFVRV
ncbi:MAG TPA: ATP-grasp fold amidoligase family protein [Blastocatellia bacterium]|nr:ATP-grasp fold amidoligase family protein [Blastocatellia bacterium]